MSCRVKALTIVVVGGGKDDPCTVSVPRSSGTLMFLLIGLGN